MQLVVAKDYAAALPLLSPIALTGTPLENYAAYYIGVAQIGLARYDEALLVLSLLAAKPLDGALKELVPLRMGEAALALNRPDRAEGALVELTEDKLAEPGAVWLMRARVEDAANHRPHALEAYRRLYYDYPLTVRGGRSAGRALAAAGCRRGVGRNGPCAGAGRTPVCRSPLGRRAQRLRGATERRQRATPPPAWPCASRSATTT